MTVHFLQLIGLHLSASQEKKQKRKRFYFPQRPVGVLTLGELTPKTVLSLGRPPREQITPQPQNHVPPVMDSLSSLMGIFPYTTEAGQPQTLIKTCHLNFRQCPVGLEGRSATLLAGDHQEPHLRARSGDLLHSAQALVLGSPTAS
jgi:hypothetical protein